MDEREFVAVVLKIQDEYHQWYSQGQNKVNKNEPVCLYMCVYLTYIYCFLRLENLVIIFFVI